MNIQDMSDEECFTALAETRLGRLGCALENQPYVVPIYFAYDKSISGDHYLYGFTTPGQKVTWMRTNPLVCVEWDEITSYDEWVSIIVFGRYEELPVISEGVQTTRAPTQATALLSNPESSQNRLQAHDLLQKHAVWWQPGYAAYVARAKQGEQEPYDIVYYRIRIDRITGRRASPETKSDAASSAETSAG